MKKQLPFIISVCLLLGLMITVATSRISWVNIHGGICGHSIYASQDNLGTPINDCNNNEYGWPARYVVSSSTVFVLNHAGPAGATIISYSSFSRLRIGADWAFWSMISVAVVLVEHILLKLPLPNLKRKPKSNITNS